MRDIESKRKFSPETRERMRAAALSRYDASAELNHERVRNVTIIIQKEISDNQGTYPHNGGAVSLAEVARRSQIHPFTFHKPRYVELGKEVKQWIEALKQGNTVGRMRVQKELSTRVQEWKKLYEDLREIHRATETDLAHTKLLLQEALQENELLQRRLAKSSKQKVVAMRLPNE